jgi:hypothetical protein
MWQSCSNNPSTTADAPTSRPKVLRGGTPAHTAAHDSPRTYKRALDGDSAA